MGTRKHNAPMRIEGTLGVGKAMTFSSAVTITEALTCSTGITVASTATLSGPMDTSTSLTIGGAEVFDVVSQPTASVDSTNITGAGGMSIIGSTSGMKYYLPTSTAGTIFYVFFSSGASVELTSSNTTNTKIAGPGGKVGTKVTGSTGDFALVVAQSSSQWNLFSVSTNAVHA